MIQFGIVALPVIPVRESASHRAEMISQLLFGECFSVIDVKNGWIFVRNVNDDYRGWIEEKQVAALSEEAFNEWRAIPKRVVSSATGELFCESSHSRMLIPSGVELPEKGTFVIGGHRFSHHFEATENRTVEALARQFLNAPYLWGGKTMFGFDCSGFSQTVFKILGCQLPRDAWQQADLGVGVDFLEETLPGDLAYFQNTEGRITHVGILLSPSRIIHCSGSVRVDKVDHQGIYHLEMGDYSHQLRFIKRVLR